ncbi:MAG: altronate dehydratase family protein [bacterium]
MDALLKIHPLDNVAVCREALRKGTVIEGITLHDDIPAGHKIALKPIVTGNWVWKYGFPIGKATEDIAIGEHVHVQNLKSGLGEGIVPEPTLDKAASSVIRTLPVSFMGYRRPDGRAAIRNEIWIINTVACVNGTSERIAARARERWCLPGSPIEGIQAFTHPYGCSQLGDDLGNTRNILAALARHPNAAAVLVLGLGCENNRMDGFLKAIGEHDPRRLIYFNAQEVSDEIDSGLVAMEKLVEYASSFQREPIPASELVLGMKCGGSDGFSGITANPLVGRVSDWLSAQGGTTLLTEVPEMFGAEAVLERRAASTKIAGEFRGMVEEFKDYFRRHDEPIYENPSPGNKDGGISTLEEKSLGCVQKGGQAPVCEILSYGKTATPGLGGLSLIQAPGNDGVSATAMTAAGAHMILFTTGRGTPLGLPVPTIKIASNGDLAARKTNWIDFNSGELLGEGVSTELVTEKLVKFVLETAEGRKTRNEINGYREIAIWKEGVTL